MKDIRDGESDLFPTLKTSTAPGASASHAMWQLLVRSSKSFLLEDEQAEISDDPTDYAGKDEDDYTSVKVPNVVVTLHEGRASSYEPNSMVPAVKIAHQKTCNLWKWTKRRFFISASELSVHIPTFYFWEPEIETYLWFNT